MKGDLGLPMNREERTEDENEDGCAEEGESGREQRR